MYFSITKIRPLKNASTTAQGRTPCRADHGACRAREYPWPQRREGDDAHNMQLSQVRAETVRDARVRRRIGAERLRCEASARRCRTPRPMARTLHGERW